MNVLPVGTAINPAYDAGDTLAPRVPDTTMLPPEALIVVSPLYVLAPDNVNVPAPDFVNPPVVVPITPLTVESPIDSTDNVKVAPPTLP